MTLVGQTQAPKAIIHHVFLNIAFLNAMRAA
jgi:hypothetical protein